jgi:hypothetical protein
VEDALEVRQDSGTLFCTRILPKIFMVMGTGMSQIQMMTRAEKETESAAERLTSQIEDARAAVSKHSTSDIDELEACADRLERAARDLATALRELSHERRVAAKEAE